MNEGHKLIEEMKIVQKKQFFSSLDLVEYIKKNFIVDEDGNTTFNSDKPFSIAELEAILICAYMERGTFRG
jgi:hypothetical protein